MLILGIDPGSRKAGFGLVRVNGRKIEYVDSGVLRYDKVSNFLDRLGLIYRSIVNILEKYQPDEIAFESLIYVKSVPALAKLAQARGAMIAACQELTSAKVHEYSPNLVKQSVSGYGHADKAAVEKALSYLVGKKSFKSSDESDAIAVAICHLLHTKPKKKSSVGVNP